MICKKCGKNTVIEEGDHYVCTNCKARAFKKNPQESENTEQERANISANNETKNDGVDISKIEYDIKQDEQSNNDNNDKKNKSKKEKSKLREAIEFFIPIVIALIIALILKYFVFANAVVPTGSMLNTIHENDRIIASRLEYNFKEPERFDIIIFKFPDNENELYVKRIIGMPGETVQIVRGVVYVTDKDGTTTQLRDDFVNQDEKPRGNFGPYVVPENSYFVMGDNRNNSYDSRYWETTNFVAKDKIIGKVKFRYFPSFEKLDN